MDHLYIGTATFPSQLQAKTSGPATPLTLRADLPTAAELDQPIPVAEARELGAWPADIAVPAFQARALENAFWRAQDRRFTGNRLTGWGAL